MEFICLLWYVKHLLIWSLISNIYKFILIYIIMIVFSCAISLLVYLSSVYWLPRLLQMLEHLGELCSPCIGRASTWGGRKNEQEGKCLSQVKWYRRGASVLQGGVSCVGQLLGPKCLRLEREGEQSGALSPAGQGCHSLQEQWRGEGHRAMAAGVWPLA